MREDPFKSLQSLMAERKALAEKEKQLLGSLNRVLPGMGYALVTASGPAPRRAPRAAKRATRSIRCQFCSRTFALPLHLGRHVAAAHKGRAARKGTKSKK